MTLHPWWSGFGNEVSNVEDLKPILARELASSLASGIFPFVNQIGLRQSEERKCAAVAFELEVERPQDLAYPIKAIEPVAVVFPFEADKPSVLSLRSDFPDTPHQNWAPPNGPYALCIDDRPWPEICLTISAHDIVRRIQLWLTKAARGELHDPAQPPDPLFFASQLSLILPAQVLMESNEVVELAGVIRRDNQNLLISHVIQPSDTSLPAFTVLVFQARPQVMARLRHAPDTLVELAGELETHGIDIIGELKARLKSWRGLDGAHVRRLSTRLAIVIAFPVTAGSAATVNDLRAFLTYNTAGEIGVALGVLYSNSSGVGDRHGYMLALPEWAGNTENLRIEPTQVHFSLDRNLAAAAAGRSTLDLRQTVLVGAGSLGSQLSINLAREGAFKWTVVDDDHLLPHNLARHALFAADIGAPKVDALTRELTGLLNETNEAIRCNILNPTNDLAPRLACSLKEARLIIDASASVAVSRHISDLTDTEARRICVFFNPPGTSAVLLSEGMDRSVTLRELEAQYYRLLLTEDSLAAHLDTSGPGLRYTGSCRALTNRIPATNAAILSALAAKGVMSVLGESDAAITIWTLEPTGEVHRVHRKCSPVIRISFDNWTVFYDEGLLGHLSAIRLSNLPNETGGILLGVADMNKKIIHVSYALSAPEDSVCSTKEFERGIVNLADQVNKCLAKTMHQLRYVGEWHSHPDYASAMPSGTDLAQLSWLKQELESEGLPGLMAIAAQNGHFAFASSSNRQAEEDGYLDQHHNRKKSSDNNV